MFPLSGFESLSLTHIVDLPPTKHGHLPNLLATPVTLCKGWQSGSMLIPALYEQSGSNIHAMLIAALTRNMIFRMEAAYCSFVS